MVQAADSDRLVAGHSEGGLFLHMKDLIEAGFDWTGLGAIFKGIAAIFKAMKDWPLPGLLAGLGLVFDVFGIFVLAAKPIA